MGEKTSIEWTDSTWNCVRGCSRVSDGCVNCYAELIASRFSGADKNGKMLAFDGFAKQTNAGPRWTNRVELVRDRLGDPLRWRRPRKIFVNSMADTFHEGLSWADIADIYGVMKSCPRHTFQVLTKRAERRRELFRLWNQSPAPNIWEGTSVENRDVLGRIDDLRHTPAAVRFLSVEPLLEDLGEINLDGIHWVILGGESGPGARPMHPDWARSVRDQCAAAKVPLFFKQWGEWRESTTDDRSRARLCLTRDRKTAPDRQINYFGQDQPVSIAKVGKKKAGRELDGRTWDEFPGAGL